MPIIFPPLELTDDSGLLAVGGNLKTENIISAYRQGIFPWPIEGHLAWFSPPRRSVLFFKNLKISNSLVKAFKRTKFEFRMNTCFQEVIRNCAVAGKRKTEGTWITEDLEAAYNKLHLLNYCHSFECFEAGKLVGGIYGICIGKMFSAESMFYLKPNASKLALVAMLAVLQQAGFEWIDCQQQSLLVSRFGAKTIARARFISLVEKAVKIEQKLETSDSLQLKKLILQLLSSKKTSKENINSIA